MSKKIALATLSLLPLATMNVHAEQIGMVTASTLNVRSGIGKQNKILFTLSKNEKVTIKSSSNGWYKIANSNNKEGWASSQYIKVVEDSVKNTKVVDVDRLNMRSGPSTSYRVLRVLTKGSSVEVISTSNNWSKIKYSGITGYVLDEHLKSNTTVKYINASGVNVRSGPSTSDSILGRLNKNDKVEIISESGSWSKINYKGSTAYVSSQYLSDKKVENDKDEEVKVENKWVTTDNLNVRSGPSTSYSILGKLNKDDKVEVISESGSWSKINYKGSTAYVSSQYLSDKK
uniref:SH3 domain-containing protein n=1 Tax=Terrisporobacter sp. TaxID=1965305 RepID=UPI0026214C76